MSKFFKVMIVLLTIVAMAVPVIASDLTMSGQMRVEGFYNDLDSNDDASMHWDQRFRVQSVWKISDDVKAILRTDIGEAQWGSAGQNSVRANAGGTWGQLHIDKAYLQIDKEMFTFSGGQQYYGSPNAILADHVGTGLVLKIKTPVSVKLQFTKFDENGSFFDDDVTTDVAAVADSYAWVDADSDEITAPTWELVPGTAATTSTANTDDTNFYSAEVGYSSDAFSVSGIYAVLDNAATDDNRSAFGVAGKFKVAGFALKAELDFLDGDNGAGTDYTGLQFYFDANTAISDALSVGGWFLYAAGDEDDTVINDVTNWDSFNPMWGGYVGGNVVAGAPITGWGPNDFIGNAGIIALAVNATFNASDDLGFKFQGVYGMEEEDAVEDFDVMNLTVSTKYKVATNTYFMADVIYEDLDSDAGDDDSISLWTQLQVNF